MKCIPTEDGSWVKPSEAAVCPCERSRAFLALTRELEGLSSDHMGSTSYMVHPSLSSLCSPQSQPLRSWLGVREFTPLELVRLAEEKCGSVGQGAPVHRRGLPPCYDIQWVAMLLACVFGEVSADISGHDATRRRQALASLPLLPLTSYLHLGSQTEDGSEALADSNDKRIFARAAENDLEEGEGWGPIYFLPSCPLTYPEEASILPSSPPSHPLSGPSLSSLISRIKGLPLTSDEKRGNGNKIRFLDPELLRQVARLEGFEGQRTSLVLRGLRDLGVEDLTPSVIMERVILPYLTSPPLSLPLPSEEHVACLTFPLCTGLLSPSTDSLIRPEPSRRGESLAHHRHDSVHKGRGRRVMGPLSSDEWLVKMKEGGVRVLIKPPHPNPHRGPMITTLSLPLRGQGRGQGQGQGQGQGGKEEEAVVLFPSCMGGWFDLTALSTSSHAASSQKWPSTQSLI